MEKSYTLTIELHPVTDSENGARFGRRFTASWPLNQHEISLIEQLMASMAYRADVE